MDHERKELLTQKKAQLKKRQKRAEIQQYKDRLTKSIEHFSQKYRYADEAEALKIETFISKLNFEQPGQLAIQEVCPYPHGNVYLCFLMGTDALFQIYVFGKYSDIMSDHDAWEVFSPYLLLVDEDFINGSETGFYIDLDAEPDYFMGHLVCIEVDCKYKIEVGGFNG